MSAIKIAARLAIAFAAIGVLSQAAFSQDAFKDFKQLGGTPKMPKLNAFTAPSAPDAPTSTARDIAMEAKLTSEGDAVKEGLSWRVFSPIPGTDGKLPMLASSEGGSAQFHLVPGEYFVNVAFGRAGVTKKLNVPASGSVQKQVLILDAAWFRAECDCRLRQADFRQPAEILRLFLRRPSRWRTRPRDGRYQAQHHRAAESAAPITWFPNMATSTRWCAPTSRSKPQQADRSDAAAPGRADHSQARL